MRGPAAALYGERRRHPPDHRGSSRAAGRAPRLTGGSFGFFKGIRFGRSERRGRRYIRFSSYDSRRLSRAWLASRQHRGRAGPGRGRAHRRPLRARFRRFTGGAGSGGLTREQAEQDPRQARDPERSAPRRRRENVAQARAGVVGDYAATSARSAPMRSSSTATSSRNRCRPTQHDGITDSIRIGQAWAALDLRGDPILKRHAKASRRRRRAQYRGGRSAALHEQTAISALTLSDASTGA